MYGQIKDINPDLMPDEYSRSVVVLLLNVIETQQKQIKGLKNQVQTLKDEISKLKGEQGKPKFSPKPKNKDISSEKESKKKKEHKKAGKKSSIEIDVKKTFELDKTNLPGDLVFKGYDTIIQQDIIFKRNNISYKVAIWWSPSQHKTYRAEATGYEGYFGNSLKSFSLVMHYYADVTRSKLLGIFHSLKIAISAGSLQNILVGQKDTFIAEKRDLIKAGLNYSYTQTDVTGASVAGELWYTHIICSDKFITYTTVEGKSRRHVLYALQGEPQGGLMLSYNQTTVQYLNHFRISKAHKSKLALHFSGQIEMSELEFRKKVSKLIPDLISKPTTLNWICDAFAFGYYHEQTSVPVVNILACDDAPEYKLVGKQRSLCWIHDARYYNKLLPLTEFHKKLLIDFKGRYWEFYHSLNNYKQAPSEKQKQTLENNFDILFIPNTGYYDLDKVIKRTRGNKKELLVALGSPEVPLHNNQSEIAARQQVRKRDICLHTMTRLGTKLQDAYMSIIQTCRLNGINPFSYILDRISGHNSDYYLPNIVIFSINSS